MNERLKERLPDVTGGKKKIFLIFLIIFFNYFMLGEPLYANVSKDTRLALLANTENAKSIYFYCIFWGKKTCYVHFLFLKNILNKSKKYIISATSKTTKPSKNSQDAMQVIHSEKKQETRINYSRKNILK